jgi:hypothetical protein
MASTHSFVLRSVNVLIHSDRDRLEIRIEFLTPVCRTP